jgi:hypothetical protein
MSIKDKESVFGEMMPGLSIEDSAKPIDPNFVASPAIRRGGLVSTKRIVRDPGLLQTLAFENVERKERRSISTDALYDSYILPISIYQTVSRIEESSEALHTLHLETTIPSPNYHLRLSHDTHCNSFLIHVKTPALLYVIFNIDFSQLQAIHETSQFTMSCYELTLTPKACIDAGTAARIRWWSMFCLQQVFNSGCRRMNLVGQFFPSEMISGRRTWTI